MQSEQIYTDGTYEALTGGTWFLQDAPYKAAQVLRMLARHPEIQPTTVCDIGCGAGGVLSELQPRLGHVAQFVGYELSPQAHALSAPFGNAKCTFVNADPFEDEKQFDLALVLDVVEHVEDCFRFVRNCGKKARWKLYILPLDTSASMVLRGANCWESVGHLHLFTVETALKTIEYCGQRVSDWLFTPTSLERPHRAATHLTNVIRRVLPTQLAVRLLGGYSLMILAE
jgi:SAM-dependent methyltransferase